MANSISLINNRSIRRQFFLWAVLIGGLSFALIYGVNSLIVTNDKWLFNAEDLNQHYIGWKFFRRTSWRLQIGLIDGITEAPISIIYTDSIPLFAILFKLLSPILPETFQYFGLWALTCLVLQTYFAMILLNAYIKDRIQVILCSIFFTISPIILMRMFVHSSLGGNWLILAALSAWAHKKSIKGYKNNIMIWSALMILAVSIHMYYIPMILAIMCANYLNQFLDNKSKEVGKLLVVTVSVSVVSALSVMYFLGAFYGEPSILQEGVREYSANLNTFYNPQGFSIFMKDQPKVSFAQWEGYAYLGMGIIVILWLGVFGVLINNKKEKIYAILIKNKNTIISLLLLVFICGGYALSPRITWNDKILIDIPLPDAIIKVFSIFRATGRLIWPVYYIIFTIAVVFLTKVNVKKIRIIYLFTAFTILLQVIDLSPLIKNANIHTKVNSNHSIIQDDAWKELSGNFDDIEFITSFSKVGNINSLVSDFFSLKEIFDIANYACENNMNINDFYIGRRNGRLIEETKYAHWIELLSGKINDKTVYIFNKIPYILSENPSINIYECDGLIFGITSNYKWTNEPKIKITSTNSTEVLQHSYIYNGEEVGKNHIIFPGGISYGPYIPINRGKYNIKIEGLNLNEGSLDIFSHEQNEFYPISNLNLSSNNVSFDVQLDKIIYDLEIRLTNIGENNVEIKKVCIQKTGDHN